MNGKKPQGESFDDMQSDRNGMEDEATGICPLMPRDGKKHLTATTKEDKTRSRTKTGCK